MIRPSNVRNPTLMRLLAAFLAALTLSCTSGNRLSHGGQFASMSSAQPARSASTVLAMMDTTVQVHVKIGITMMTENPDTGEIEETASENGWVGSGVVYENDGKVSRILSANHVLETPAIGTIEDVVIEFFGMKIELGKRRIDSVKITVTTNGGKTCNVKPLVMGSSDYRDVATAEVDCDAGRVAKIARSTPAQGEKIYISGHPLGVPVPIVTEGYVSGYFTMEDGKFLMVSAGAYGGNSGGPVFYNGEVIGLLVRGSRSYTNISLVTTLEQVLLRVADTQ